eukprot:PhM_4_TR1940/c0_g1_i1/m.91890
MSYSETSSSRPTAAPDILATCYDRIASAYSEMMEVEMKRCASTYERVVVELLLKNDTPQGPILDSCCGSGHVLKLISMNEPERPLFGSDLSPAMVECTARLMLITANNNNNKFQVGDMRDLSEVFPCNGTFAAILNLFAIHHLSWEDVQEKFFPETNRLLKKEGVFVLGFWSTTLDGDFVEKNKLEKRERDHCALQDGTPEEWGATFMYSPQAVQDALRSQGFAVITCFETWEADFEMMMSFVVCKKE